MRRHRVEFWLMVGLVLFSAALSHAQETPEHAEPSWELPESWIRAVAPFQIADDLYYVGTEQLSSFLFKTDAGLILLDVPMQQNVEAVLTSIRTLGFDPADIRILLASHGHFDHVGGLASMQELTGAQVVVSARDAELIANGGRGDFFLGDRAPYPAAIANRLLAPGDKVRLGGVTLQANLTAGHTRGCTSWSADITVDGAPHRMVVVCSLSVLDGYQLGGEAKSYPGIAADYCNSVRTLRNLGADVFLAAHPSFFDMARKAERLSKDPAAFVDPAGLHRYLSSALASINETLTAQGVDRLCN